MRRRPGIGKRRMAALASTLMLVATSVAGGLGVNGDTTQPAAAADPLSCAVDNYYAVQNNGQLRHVNASVTPATATSVGTGWTSGNSGGTINANVNGLAVSPGGAKAYAYIRTGTGNNLSTARILQYDAATDTFSGASSTYNTQLGLALITGAVNPADGNYYFGGYNSSGQLRVWRYNTTTNAVDTTYSLTVDRPGGVIDTGQGAGLNGDIAFSDGGALYFVSSPTNAANGDQLWSLSASAFNAGGSQNSTKIGANFDAGAAINGIALTADGNLALSVGNAVTKRNAITGTLIGTIITSAGVNISDLASCVQVSTLTLKKNVDQRLAPSDQFVLNVTSGTNPVATATTSGSTAGVQPVEAGPAPVNPGSTYTISEIMAPGSATSNISAYTPDWSCYVDDPQDPFATGYGSTGSVEIPSTPGDSITCMFINPGSPPPAPSLSLSKTANPTSVSAAGETVTYSFEVTNTGNVTIDDITISEDAFSGTGATPVISCPPGALAEGAMKTCTATYDVTQADVDAGQITNTATAHGKDPSNGDVDSNQDDAIVTATATPSLLLTKSADPTTVSAKDDSVTYSFVVTNDGNVTVDNLSIFDDAFSGTGTLSAVSCPVTTLAPTESTTCTATYDVTQADINAGQITNAATAHGTGPSGVPVVSNPDNAVVTATQGAALTLAKSVDPSTVSAQGDSVTYSFVVTNSGNVTVDDITISEDAFSGTGTMSAISCPVTSLDPTESTTCTATYSVTQDDINAGQVTNTATAHGTDPDDDPVVSDPDDAIVTAAANPSLTLTKSADPATVSAEDDSVTYSFVVTNDGNVAVDDLTISEDAFSGTGTMSAISCPVTSLDPTESTTCTATYSVTQADINAGQVTNTATAHGTDPDDNPVASDPDDAVVTATQGAALTLAKSVDPSTVSAEDDSVTYSFVVTNSGNVTVDDITISEDAFSGTGTLSVVSCPVTSLDPTESTTCTATYSVTQADINAGQVTNTATAHGTDPDDNPVASDPDDAVVTATQGAALTLAKSVSPTLAGAAGDTATYSFVVTNTGNVTVDDITISEDAFSGTGTMSAISCPVTSLDPTESTTCTATYDVTQHDIDAGEITNTATAHGTDPSDGPVVSNPDDAIVTAASTPALSLVKTADPATVASQGDSVTYSFEVSNVGNVTIDDITISEDAFSGTGILSAISCPVTSLAPLDFTICTATYDVTQADINAGQITNTATAHGTDPSDGDVDSNQDDAIVTAVSSPSLLLTKSADPATVSAAGDAVAYSFTVTNNGNVPVDNLSISEDSFSGTGTLSAVSCPVTSLDPTDSTTCTATYTVTQDDIEAGEVTNTATAHGTDPSGNEVDSNPDDAYVDAPADPALALLKSADPTTVSAQGDLVTYSFTVTNIGNVALEDVTVYEDTFTGTDPMSAIDCPVTSLAPDASTICTATYNVTQDDINAGQVINSAHAEARRPNSDMPVESNLDEAVVTASQGGALALDKSVSPATVNEAGDSVTYSFTVTNNGNVTIDNITISEDAFSGTGTLSAVSCPVTTLDPTDSTTCTATYSVTQDDVDAGTVTNTATAHGTDPSQNPVASNPDDAEVDIPAAPSLSLTKSVSPATVNEAGDSVTYSFVVTNTGNVTVDNLTISEDAFSGTGTMSAVSCPVTTLGPTESTTCTATYSVTQDDVDAGTVTNTATAHGTDPSDNPVASNQDEAEVDIPAAPELSLVKSANPATVASQGDSVTYSFEVSNTGNVTIDNLSISEDSFSGTDPMSAVSCPVTTLAPTESTTCTATYSVTQADINAGQITNTATAHGVDPDTMNVDSNQDDAIVTATQGAALTLDKSVSPATVSAAGDSVTYSFLVTNNGNVTIDNLSISEDAFSGTGTLSAVSCPVTTLGPTESTTCTATYSVTQDDVDAGTVTNTATAHGTDPSDSQVDSNPDEAEVDIPAAPGLGLVKSANPTTVNEAGDSVTYSFEVSNTGNVTIDNLTISEDVFSGTGTMSAVSCPVTTLAPTESTTCTATYDVTQPDIDAGQITNTATAHGTPPDPQGPPVDSPPSDSVVDAPAAPVLTLTKSADPTTVHEAGDSVTYSFVVTNNGNVTIDDITISEDAFSGTGTMSAVSCPVTTLGPTESTTCTATYSVTQDDVDAGTVTNTATAHGTDPSQNPVESNQDEAEVDIPAAPALALTKSANPATVTSQGDSVTYSFEVTNTGNVTITSLGLTEDSFSGTGTLSAISCPVTTLGPTESTICTATYSVTQDDINTGQVTNAATAHGVDPDSMNVDSNQDDAVVTATRGAALTLDKSVSPATVHEAGDEVTYSFTVTNNGNVTIDDITISEDAFSGTGTMSAISCPVTTLDPTDSTTCTATYSVTQDDVDAGTVTNTATAHGTDPSDSQVDSNPDEAEVDIPAAPALSLVKSANPATVASQGDSVTYSFEVTNTGNVTITSLGLTEDSFSGTGTLSAISCPVTTLAPTDSTTCTATYSVTQEDINTGQVTNTATAHGVDPDSMNVDSNQDDAVVTADQNAGLTLDKSVSPATVHDEGDSITYSFTVTNNGNVTIDNITISEDAFSGTGTMSAISCPVTTLDPTDSTTCTATYSVTQDDVDAGTVTNTATAHGTDPSQNPVESDPDDAEVDIPAAPGLSLVKSANPVTVASQGDSVTYSFEVTNTGNVTITSLGLTEDSFSGTGTLSAISCPVTTLGPTESTTCTATYSVTQDDINTGQVTNTATAHGVDPDSMNVDSNQDDAVVTADQNAGLTLDKSVSPATVHAAGDSVTYSFEVSNTGNVTIDNLTISEDVFSGTGTLSAVSCPVTMLDPTESTTCTATYDVTQADVDAGTVTNTATAHGTDPSDNPVASNQDDAEVDIPAAPALTLTKSANPATVHDEGDPVTYSFLVTNTGNVTIGNLTISEDSFSGTGTMSAISCPVTTLGPTESTTCTATYSVTQDDVDTGQVTNTATAHGTPPNPDDPPVDSPPSDSVVDIPAAPALTLTKSANPATVHDEGDSVTYSFLVTNSGNVTIDNLTVTEDAFSGTGTMSAISCPVTTLGPTESTTCTATYSVTQDDVDAGTVTNTATAHGTDPSDDSVNSPPSEATVDIPAAPALSLVKSADPTTVHAAGDSVTYSFLVTNTGNVTIDNVSIAETSFSGTGTLSATTCPATTLAPGASTTCTATYSVTQDDVDAGQVTNTATAHGTPPNPEDPPVVSPPSDSVVDAPADPSLSLVKSVSPATVHAAGDSVTYSFLVANTGNVTVHGITISEDSFSGTGAMSATSCPVTTLAPGASTTCTATYSVTQDDVDAGQVTNTATAHGTPPNPEDPPVVSPPSDSVVDAPADPSLSLVKTVDPATVAVEGDSVTYSFEVTNTGNVTIDDITISEDSFSGTGAMSEITCPDTTLAPGESTTCTATYTVTQDDVDAAQITNTATAHGTPPNPEDPPVVSPPSETTVDIPADPAISLEKTGATPHGNGVGKDIIYTLVATNTGNVTLHDVTISDPMLGGDVTPAAAAAWDSGLPGTLAPGETVTATVSYTITEADGEAGSVVNTATATGDSPDDKVSSRVTSQDNESIPTTPAEGSGGGQGSRPSNPSKPTPTGQLPKTGLAPEVKYLGFGGLMMLALGAGIIVITRRRRGEATGH